ALRKRELAPAPSDRSAGLLLAGHLRTLAQHPEPGVRGPGRDESQPELRTLSRPSRIWSYTPSQRDHDLFRTACENRRRALSDQCPSIAGAIRDLRVVNRRARVVGREGFEPPQLSRVVYSHLSSPMPSRPTYGEVMVPNPD